MYENVDEMRVWAAINTTLGTYNAENTSYAIKLNILGNTIKVIEIKFVYL